MQSKKSVYGQLPTLECYYDIYVPKAKSALKSRLYFLFRKQNCAVVSDYQGYVLIFGIFKFRKDMLLSKLKQRSKERGFSLIAGLNVIQSYESTLHMAQELKAIATSLDVELVFKASCDKANRTNEGAYRGPGMVKGLEYLARLKQEMMDLAIVTDVHETHHCELVRKAGLDMIQIPAFLCRQTDLIHAAADTGLPVLLKKGQFASVDVIKAAEIKIRSRPKNSGVIICERGTCVGPDQLVVDFKNLVLLRSTTSPSLVALDATHAAQRPAFRAREGKGSDGDLFVVQALARAGVAVGIDCLFLEVHENPALAPVDGKIQWPLKDLQLFLKELLDISRASKWRSIQIL